LYVFDEYFFGDFDPISLQSSKYTPFDYLTIESRDELLVERNFHLCNQADHSNFVPNFKTRYNAKDEHLLKNQNL